MEVIKLQNSLNEGKKLLDNLFLDVNNKKQKLEELNLILDKENWQEKFNEILKEKSYLEKNIKNYEELLEEYNFIIDLLNSGFLKEDVENEILLFYKKVHDFMVENKFSLEDESDCFMEIQAGTGGDDGEDLTNMLFKMYEKWSEKNNYIFNIIHVSYSDHGIKGALIKIEGEKAYGFLKHETGIHRFVRHSPFNSLNKRQTSFIGVNIYPFQEEEAILIEEKDLEYSFFRASGAGGQHVNKTDSAVRIKHIPTGIIVSCQNERSQTMNKSVALKFLKVKLKKKALMEKENLAKNANLDKKNISWGSQIRSYVLNPYKLVKDLRTGYETTNIMGFLNGDLVMECLYFNLMKL
jgi:peptide chain release factor 2